MTLDELIDTLTELQEEGYGDARVRLAFQPSWPLRLTVGSITARHEEDDGEEPDEEYDGPVNVPPPGIEPDGPDQYIVWIADGGHPDNESPYAPGNVF